MKNCSVLILGVGNIYRKDDGIGIHVLNRLSGMSLGEGTRLLDGGTAGIDIVSYLEGVDRLIIVDAVLTTGVPGDIRVLNGTEIAEKDLFISGHYGRISDMLDMAAALWKRPETFIVGIVPGDCESYEYGLSPELAAVQDKVAACVLRLAGGASD
ncbi:MAG: hydrogenase maturation protease [Nitrospiraceae bacterium]|nr:hydrogenase maturation protease [Nitrospiraceae bacterium]